MATAYEYHGSRYIQWTQDGKRQKQCLGRSDLVTEREANLAAKTKEVELATGKVIFTGAPLLSDFVTEYLAWHEREYPASHWRVEQIIHQHLLPEFGHLPLDGIRTRAVETYKQKRRLLVRSGTVTKELRTLRAILNRAVEWEAIDRMPMGRVQGPQELDSRPVEFYMPEQLSALYQASPNHRYIWQLYANTGMRRMEGLHLRKADVGREAIRVLSTEQERTKSAKWREIPLTDNAREALQAIDGGGSHVIPRTRPESLTRAFRKCLHRARLPGSLHSLRHTYISHLVMASVPLRVVQRLAGHAHYSTTEKYAHLAPGFMQDLGSRINL